MVHSRPSGRTTDGRDVLLVEDEPADVRLLEEAFAEAAPEHTLHVVADGDEMLEFLLQQGSHASAPSPSLVLLDLELPDRRGTELLETVRDTPELERLPVVMLTVSDDPDDVVDCYANEVNAYLTKPDEYEDVVALVETLDEFWFGTARLPPD